MRPAAAARIAFTAERLARADPRMVAADDHRGEPADRGPDTRAYAELIMAKEGGLHTKRKLVSGKEKVNKWSEEPYDALEEDTDRVSRDNARWRTGSQRAGQWWGEPVCPALARLTPTTGSTR